MPSDQARSGCVGVESIAPVELVTTHDAPHEGGDFVVPTPLEGGNMDQSIPIGWGKVAFELHTQHVLLR